MRQIKCKEVGDVYVCLEDYTYYSPRYKKSLTVPEDYPSNGANVVKDKCPTAFFVHDLICDKGKWDDGTPMCNREASSVYADILKDSGFWWRSKVRWIGTYLGGGGEAKENGWWNVKNKKDIR